MLWLEPELHVLYETCFTLRSSHVYLNSCRICWEVLEGYHCNHWLEIMHRETKQWIMHSEIHEEYNGWFLHSAIGTIKALWKYAKQCSEYIIFWVFRVRLNCKVCWLYKSEFPQKTLRWIKQIREQHEKWIALLM